jgi:hypothetical protein
MKNSHPTLYVSFSPLQGKKNSENTYRNSFLVQISIKFTLKKIRETFPELFRDEKEFLRGGMRIFLNSYLSNYLSKNKNKVTCPIQSTYSPNNIIDLIKPNHFLICIDNDSSNVFLLNLKINLR